MSSKNCLYPQQIIVALENTVVVQQMQILGHHCFVPERIDIWVGADEFQSVTDKDVNKQQYRYVGFVSMKSNDDTQYKCRELKTITIPYSGATKYIKLMLHQNHPNSLNSHDQVAIVAIQVMGKEIFQETVTGVDGVYPDAMSNSAIMFDDLAFEMYVDKDIAHLLKMLHHRKRSAVKDERFEYARKLKHAMEELQLAGETLGKLQIAKNQAIEQEDYSRAKRKKVQIDEFKLQVYNSLNIDELLEKDGILSCNDEEEKTDGGTELVLNNNTEDGRTNSNCVATNSSGCLLNGGSACEHARNGGDCNAQTKVLQPSPLQTFLVETHLQTPVNNTIDRAATPCECAGSSARIWPTSPNRNK